MLLQPEPKLEQKDTTNKVNGVRKIALIGPVLPFKGGISQHTTMLHRAMGKRCELLTISFSRQYPAWLFPGETDIDPDYEEYLEEGVEYLIDSLNPLTWKKAVHRVLLYSASIVVIPWWTVFWSPCFGYVTNALRKNGVEIVFLCHNVIEHEAATWKSWLTRRVLKNGNRFVVHTLEDESNLKRLIPSATVAVHSHPIYNHFPKPAGTLKRRKGLELLFYGFVRHYKGLDILIEAMGQLRNEDIYLTIAGEFWNNREKVLKRIVELGIEKQIDVNSRYHSEQETAELFSRADAVVLPYRSATGSGVVPIAYHYNRPVIVTRVGGLPDVVKESETGYVIPPENIQALAQLIRRLDRDTCQAMRPKIMKFKQSFSWDKLVSALLNDTEEMSKQT